MKNIKLSAGDAQIASNCIYIVFNLDSKPKLTMHERFLKRESLAYLQNLGILNKEGCTVFAKFPSVVQKAIDSFM